MANTFKRKLSRTVGTSLTSVGSYTVPSSTAVVNDGSNDTHLIKDAPVPSGGSIVIVGGDQKVVLETADSVKVSSNTASSVDVVMSILEIT